MLPVLLEVNEELIGLPHETCHDDLALGSVHVGLLDRGCYHWKVTMVRPEDLAGIEGGMVNMERVGV